MRTRLPRYYCPRVPIPVAPMASGVGATPSTPTVPRPSHLPEVFQAIWVVDEHGPDVASGGPGGGMIYGGKYIDDEPGWHLTDAGWWINVDGVTPDAWLRVDPMLGQDVVSSVGEWVWHVPSLLEPAPGAWLSTIQNVLKPDGTWGTPRVIAAVQERLRYHWSRLETDEWDDELEQTTLDLAIEILQLNYPGLTQYEIGYGEWLSADDLTRIHRAAGSLSPDPLPSEQRAD